MRSKGSAAELEGRRRLAVQRVSEGWKRQDVAALLGVHPETVGEWVRAHQAGGDAAPAAKPHPGRKSFLTPGQERRVLGWLADPPTRHRFRTDLSTAERVAHRIDQRLGVTFHPRHLRGWLAKRGYTPQEPARRATQRDPAAIDRWPNEDWLGITQTPGGRTPTSS